MLRGSYLWNTPVLIFLELLKFCRKGKLKIENFFLLFIFVGFFPLFASKWSTGVGWRKSILKLISLKDNLNLRGYLHEISFRVKRDISLHFGVWSISYNCSHDTTQHIAGVISLWLYWQKWNFISGDKMSCEHYPKWDYTKGNICAWAYFIKTSIIDS